MDWSVQTAKSHMRVKEGAVVGPLELLFAMHALGSTGSQPLPFRRNGSSLGK